MKVATAWVNNNDFRTQTAQHAMILSLFDHGLEPVIFNGTPRPLLSEMLQTARRLSPGDGFFGWVNSDCSIIRWPQPDPAHVIGLHRVETGNNSVCLGVDGYIFPCQLWDGIYATDCPELYVGATHVDWWLTRLAEKHGIYKSMTGLLHPSHERTTASKGLDQWGRHNLIEFAAWAKQNGIETK